MSRAWLLIALLLLLVVALPNSCSAFITVPLSWKQERVLLLQQREKHSYFPTKIIRLYNTPRSNINNYCEHNDDNDDKNDDNTEIHPVHQRRRLFVKKTAVVALLTTGVVWMGGCPPLRPQVEPAHATYSAYSHREDDWKQRQASGEVQFTSAASLRSQLKEMVPQNDSGRLLFCPNGPTAAVSPLMENKCGDKLAMPSVYGRTEDTMGNSIPGFAGGFYSSGLTQSISSSADPGGLPSYSKYTTGK